MPLDPFTARMIQQIIQTVLGAEKPVDPLGNIDDVFGGGGGGPPPLPPLPPLGGIIRGPGAWGGISSKARLAPTTTGLSGGRLMPSLNRPIYSKPGGKNSTPDDLWWELLQYLRGVPSMTQHYPGTPLKN